jgi:hypothetical protein
MRHADPHGRFALSPLALALVLGSAALHASWNLFAKRAGGGTGGPAFVFSLLGLLTALIYAPLAIAQGGLRVPDAGVAALVAVLGSGCCTWVTSSRCSTVTASATCRWCTRWRAGAGRCSRRSGRSLWLGERPSAWALAGTGWWS